jgi:lysyl-tRNA synthetase class 2
MFQTVRAFFSERSVLEVDCPALSPASSIDLHIDVMTLEEGYLHTSPEYGMKQLLSLGSGDIFQMSHVFRRGEQGVLHNPEFTMVEWYREGFSFAEMVDETVEFIRLFLGKIPVRTYSYRAVFQTFLGIDPAQATVSDLLACAHKQDIHLPADAPSWDLDTLLQLLMSFAIEPHLGREELCVISYFPASQAALSQVAMHEGRPAAERFEIYYRGIELANGYHELTNPAEQRKRLEESNAQRQAHGKTPLPIDETFLAALERGIPDCCGVAVGFDRLLMLRHGASSIHTILPLS